MFDEAKYQDDCANFPLNELLQSKTIDSAWDIFKSLVLHVANTHAPLRESRVRGCDMPWITVDLREQMYKRDHLRRVAIRSKSPGNYQNYRVQRNKTRTCLRNAKKRLL